MGYMGFEKLKAKISAKGGIKDLAAVAASIGKEKYGAEKFEKAASAGKKMEGMKPLKSIAEMRKRIKSKGM